MLETLFISIGCLGILTIAGIAIYTVYLKKKSGE